MKQFVSDPGVGAVPHLSDPAGKIWQRFGITRQSGYVFVDAAGAVVHRGYLDDLQLTAKVREPAGQNADGAGGTGVAQSGRSAGIRIQSNG